MIKMNIADNCLENGMAEQFNGILKNDYLCSQIRNVRDLNRKLLLIKNLINKERPVAVLGYKTPIEFEQWIENRTDKPSIKLYDFKSIN